MEEEADTEDDERSCKATEEGKEQDSPEKLKMLNRISNKNIRDRLPRLPIKKESSSKLDVHRAIFRLSQQEQCLLSPSRLLWALISADFFLPPSSCGSPLLPFLLSSSDEKEG